MASFTESSKPGLCRIDNKIALITGASSGIGAGTAILFAELGAKLALTGRKSDGLKKTADECEKISGERPFCVIADLSKEEDVIKVMEETIGHFKNLDILVNNAGIGVQCTIENTTMEDYDKVMNINVRAVYQLTALAVPHLIKSKGTIVNVSSVNGMRSFPGVLPYNMSKSAIDQFTRCTALELASKQVRVNSVNPGVIRTEIHRRMGNDEEQYAKFLERSKSTHALGRVGTTDEVARVIAFLASDASSFITGAQIPVDGGRHAMCPR